jgi:hypothetical protein
VCSSDLKDQRFVLELWLDPAAADDDDFQRRKSLITF